MAVVEEGGFQVALLVGDEAVGGVFGAAYYVSAVISPEDGGADLIVVVGFGFVRLIDLVEKAETIHVEGFGAVRVVFYEEVTVGRGGVAGGSCGVC